MPAAATQHSLEASFALLFRGAARAPAPAPAPSSASFSFESASSAPLHSSGPAPSVAEGPVATSHPQLASGKPPTPSSLLKAHRLGHDGTHSSSTGGPSAGASTTASGRPQLQSPEGVLRRRPISSSSGHGTPGPRTALVGPPPLEMLPESPPQRRGSLDLRRQINSPRPAAGTALTLSTPEAEGRSHRQSGDQTSFALALGLAARAEGNHQHQQLQQHQDPQLQHLHQLSASLGTAGRNRGSTPGSSAAVSPLPVAALSPHNVSGGLSGGAYAEQVDHLHPDHDGDKRPDESDEVRAVQPAAALNKGGHPEEGRPAPEGKAAGGGVETTTATATPEADSGAIASH